MEQMGLPLLLDIKDAAKVLNLSEDYLYRHWQSYPFAFKMGKQIRFSVSGIIKYIDERQVENLMDQLKENGNDNMAS
jgi:hypothetical protein